MTPKSLERVLPSDFLQRVQRDYDNEKIQLDWESYLAGYWAGIMRFGDRPHRAKRNNREQELVE